MSTGASFEAVPAARARTLSARPAVSRSRPGVFRIGFSPLVVSSAAFLLFVVVWGGSYYATPLTERVLHARHEVLKPSGALGHAMGIAGTVMMLLIFVYSLRKKWKPLQRIGTQSQWLQVHIFLGLAGPVLVTFHSTGKLGGIVAVAFYSMWAMAVSGMVGRYLYAKIPRTVQGNKMSLKEIEDQLAELVETLRHTEKKHAVLRSIETFLSHTRRQRGGLLRAVVRVLGDDIRLPLHALRVWRLVRIDRSLPFSQRWRVTRLVLRQQRILNHLAVLDAMQRLFSYWHVFHRPFTVITFVIVFLHVGVAVYLGYGFRW